MNERKGFREKVKQFFDSNKKKASEFSFPTKELIMLIILSSFLTTIIFLPVARLLEPDLKKATQILTTMVTILSTIFAIIASVLPIAFELQKEKYGSHVFETYFLPTFPFKFILFCYFTAIGGIIIALLAIKEEPSYAYWAPLIISLFLFFICLFLFIFEIPLFLLVPEEIKEEVKEKIKEKFKKLFESCKEKQSTEETKSKGSNKSKEISSFNLNQESPILDLQEIFSIMLQNKDREIIDFILSTLTQNTEELLKSCSEISDDTLEHILDLFEYYIDESFARRDSLTIIKILNSLKCLEKVERSESDSFVSFVSKLSCMEKDVLNRAREEKLTYVQRVGFDP